MNKYVRAAFCVSLGLLKFGALKITRGKNIEFKVPNLISPLTEITVDRGGRLIVGKMLRMRSGAKLRVRKDAMVSIGENLSMSNHCMIVAWEKIELGDNVQFGPGVLIYDHDHDYTAPGGLAAEKYKTSPVKIGNNVWIGANSIILRGTTIGDNCVIAAGTIVKGKVEDNTLVYQKRENENKTINYKIDNMEK